MPDQHALDDDAEHERHDDRREDAERERVVARVGEPARVRADREQPAVREVHEAEQSEDDRQAERDERKDRTERNPVEQLRCDQMNRQTRVPRG